MQPRLDPKTLVADAKSSMWAYQMGRHARAVAPTYTRWDKACPFKEGSPHEDLFHRGWKGMPL